MGGNLLQHHGIIGQKWGVRRFQNRDGSLTSAGKSRLARKDEKWIKKKSEGITQKAKQKSARELDRYAQELLRNPNALKKDGKLSAETVNAYNQRMAALMNAKVSGLRSPSGKVVQFVAKRGEIGVFMALADEGYDMSQIKNGIWGNGRVAYKQSVLDKVER